MKNKYHGITWVGKEQLEEDCDELLHIKLWKDSDKCSNGQHLFDEVWNSEDEHFLYCDACGLEVHIKEIKKGG